MRLFAVELKYHTVIAAETEEQALEAAMEVVGYENPVENRITGVDSHRDLPANWKPTDHPWGRATQSRTCEQFLAG